MKLNKPYPFFWATALILFSISFLYKNSNQTIDVNIYDTYIIVAKYHQIIFVSIILFSIGLLYFLHDKLKVYLTKKLSLIHTLITIVGFTICLFPPFNSQKKDEFPLLDTSTNYIQPTIIIVLILIQFVFILNSAISIYKYLLKKL
ncbi:hypothetical protein GCM10022291_02540 [Postechiella marina]|uniref:Uncharacterized protein n=1 Tax=Postechiella marina TaxID=943941 RepID=A0ABP8BZK3_9FLAO